MQVNGPEDDNGLGVSVLSQPQASLPIANEASELVPHIFITHPLSDLCLLSECPYSDHGLEDNALITLDDPAPPLGVKLTVYRLLNMSVVSVFGITKAILTYMGQSVAPTTLDWIAGALLGTM
jgi:hypothetical protein